MKLKHLENIDKCCNDFHNHLHTKPNRKIVKITIKGKNAEVKLKYL